MTTTHRIRTSAALALALAASAAPAAARPFDLNANGSYVPAGSASVQAPSQPTQPSGVPPILPVATSSQRAALRQAQQQERPAYLATHQPTSAKYSSAEMNIYRHATPTAAVHVASHDVPFAWDDAGIGAAGALALALAGFGGAFAVSRQRRVRRSKGSAVIAS